MSAVDALAFAGGVVLIGWTLFDAFVTVFLIGGGAGPQSAFVADRLWRGALALHDDSSSRSHSLMRAAGPVILLVVLLAWVLGLVLGWALVFPVRAFEDGASLEFADRLLFAGLAIVGRTGNSPTLAVAGDGWELLNALAGLSGVFIVSVGLASVLPILASVAHKRSIAASVHTLGDSVADMRELGRTPGNSAFELHLVALVSTLALAAEQHRAYPVLHYFHSRDRHAALAPAVAKVSLLLRGDLDGIDKVDATVRRPLERSVSNLIAALSGMGLSRYAHDLADIDDAGLEPIGLDPTEDGAAYDRPVAPAWLEAYVRFDGWDWDEVATGGSAR